MLKRTKYCGLYREADIGETAVACGWVQTKRDMGGVIFVDLRDREGVLQVVFNAAKLSPEEFAAADKLKNETVIAVKGPICLRDAETVNEKLATGTVELRAVQLEVISEADPLPFPLDDPGVKDELRLKYRYLDLRRPEMVERLRFRHRVQKCAEDYLDSQGFLSVETPMLTKSTPEGARDYLVPSRVHHGEFYALPQSPQIFKQLLMVGGIDRYYQVARCFRDEDLRADRQPEFTQVDMEMSFVEEEDIETMNEGLIKKLFKEILDVEVETPFLRMPYAEAMARFGSDKPDTRFGLELQDVTDVLRESGFAVFKSAVEAGGSVRLINAKGLAGALTRKEIDKLTEVVRTYGAKGLAYTRCTAENETSSFEKFLTAEEKAALRSAAGVETGDVLLVVADAKNDVVFAALGALRLEIAKKFGLIDPDRFDFLWVTDFPFFEYSHFSYPSLRALTSLFICPGMRAFFR